MQHIRKSENYQYHVLRIGKFDFCNGCFANRLFLTLLLPFYLWNIAINSNPYLFEVIVSYMLFQIFLTVFIAATGRRILTLTSGILTTFYVLFTHNLIINGDMVFEIPQNILLFSILVFILPQMLMYMWKINQKAEFKYPKSKLVIRLFFIHAYLCTVFFARSNLIQGASIIVLGSASFVLIREMSARNLNNRCTKSTNVSRNYFDSLVRNISKSRFISGILSPNDLVEDINASQDDCCELCCGCCACIFCCATCGMCGDMEDYTPVDAGFS